MAEETTAAAASSVRQERNEPRKVEKESSEMNETKESAKQRRKDATATKDEISIPKPAESAAKGWFQGLSSEERAAVASFADEAFLGTLLAYAAPWSGGSHSPASGEGGEYWNLRRFYVIFRVVLKLNRQDFCAGRNAPPPMMMRSEDCRSLCFLGFPRSLMLLVFFAHPSVLCSSCVSSLVSLFLSNCSGRLGYNGFAGRV